jgi:hypothetical protein
VLDALWNGLVLGIGFNPLASLVGPALAAMLLAREPGRLRWALAALVLAGAWFLGDGANLVGYAQEGLAALSAAEWVEMGLWIIVGFGVGYVLPTWAGVFVGRRVTWGTGWASAGVTAATVLGIVTALSARLVG